MKNNSSFDAIKDHLSTRGCNKPVARENVDDLETLVRRCDQVRSLGEGYGSVELSPYMASLLRVSKAPVAASAARLAPVAASV